MPSLKDVKLQITGVGKTKQITRAMGMVASAKLRGAQNRIERFRPYAEKFHEILGSVAGWKLVEEWDSEDVRRGKNVKWYNAILQKDGTI